MRYNNDIKEISKLNILGSVRTLDNDIRYDKTIVLYSSLLFGPTEKNNLNLLLILFYHLFVILIFILGSVSDKRG